MECPTCGADLHEDANVCFRCETVFPPTREERVRAIRDAAERDDFARTVHGASAKFDETEYEYQALSHANYKIHRLPWEHPIFDMGVRDYIHHEINWQIGFLIAIGILAVSAWLFRTLT